MLPILKNQVAQIRNWSFTEMFKPVPDNADGKAIRNATYKLLSFDDGHQEFYNLTTDYYENNNLLNGTLSSIELINYNYLCNELSNLIGAGNYCTLTSIEEPRGNSNLYLFVPNPFFDYIKWNMPHKSTYVQLIDSTGKLIYSGNEMETVNFSSLAPGIYFATTNGATQKLIKTNN